MPVSPEQRKILLERLEMARKAKAEKHDVPKAERKKKEPVVVDTKDQLVDTAPVQPPVAAAAAPVLQKPQETHTEEPPKNKKNAKNKYMKVVFYSEPGKKKVENLLKSLEDDEPLPAPVTTPKVPRTSVQKNNQPFRSQKTTTALINWLASILANYFPPPCSLFDCDMLG
jgi:hypothetical protein